MSREAQCGPAEARKRLRVARTYLEIADLAAQEHIDEARNVAAGNAVLAIKDPAHYGESFISDTKLKTTLRAAQRLVDAADASILPN